MAVYISRGVLLKYRSRAFRLKEVRLPFEVCRYGVCDFDFVAGDGVVRSGAVLLCCVEFAPVRILSATHESLPRNQGDDAHPAQQEPSEILREQVHVQDFFSKFVARRSRPVAESLAAAVAARHLLTISTRFFNQKG